MNLVLKYGNDTKIEETSISIEEVPHRPGRTDNVAYHRVRIVQKLTISAEVLIPVGWASCCICKKPVPELPEESAARFILENHDFDRICFPAEENVRSERDTYPVPGWKRTPYERESGLICPECHAEFMDFLEKKKGKRDADSKDR